MPNYKGEGRAVRKRDEIDIAVQEEISQKMKRLSFELVCFNGVFLNTSRIKYFI